MLTRQGNCLVYQYDHEILTVQPWGADSLRIRATHGASILPNDDFALLPTADIVAEIALTDNGATMTNGLICCKIDRFGVMTFYRGDEAMLREYERNRYRSEERPLCSALELRPRMYAPIIGTENYHITARFEANEGERLYGMGQYQQDNLDLKGCILELAHRNSQISVPFVLSSKGYGLLWNNPAIGKVVFGNNLTEWDAESTRQLDYWITCGDTPAQIEENYSAVVGCAPMMPEEGLGFWQSKLRYQTQEELLEVAREYHRRGVPVSVIVADFFHWPHQGDWQFDPEYWPDPKAMVDELTQMGMKLMVSIWPTVHEDSINYKEMLEKGYLVRSEQGSRMRHLGNACYFDVTNPEARAYMWGKLKENYYQHGIRIFWLDEAEPEYTGYGYSNIRYHIGTDLEKGNLFPRCYASMAFDGMRSEGQEDIINLVRCAWVGSQRYGALVWSGDIESTFSCLRTQLTAGLNMSLAGIPWWTTDIGGFHNGNVNDPVFRELVIRWFQFGAFSPVFRLHGFREPQTRPLSNHGGGSCNSGATNEIWSYGEEACGIFTDLIQLRGRMHDYIAQTMELTHKKGQPVIRPVFYNVPEDPETWKITDQYFFGEDVLVCPVMHYGQRDRSVYLPKGFAWRSLHDDSILQGGQTITVNAPLDVIPVFIKADKLTELRIH